MPAVSSVTRHRVRSARNFAAVSARTAPLVHAVNLTARLQSHAEIDGILLGHETYSLVKDEVAAEEQTPIKVKGFAEPIRCYKVQGSTTTSPRQER